VSPSVSKRRSSSPNVVLAMQTGLQKHLSFSTHARQRFSNIKNVSRLSRRWKSVQCPVFVTQNDVLDHKMSQMSHTCHTKWTNSKKGHGAVVKRCLGKKQIRSHILWEPARSKRTWTSHKGTFTQKMQQKNRRPDGAPCLI
jgi:hypothetical protein